ncbi:hypothetical protein DPMN_042838 [Dreissena polymorpha]|uniref:Uncharacterized protein n=1 Tax=Dreissena polymorpha TaxID=45954 RepID=A0A9D4D096_DREPO|nr:hypothetical protein DPMN_042838 [Dreissena polymorpha]
MFGNQQNEAKEMSKRVDPSMEDQSGSVFSDEAKDIESPTESLEEEQNDVFDDGENEDGTDGLNESEMEALAEADEANNGDTTALESAENEDEANEAYAKYLKTLQGIVQ